MNTLPNHYLQGAHIVNEGKIQTLDVEIREGKIKALHVPGQQAPPADLPITSLKGKYLLPGLIDDQVHFREPGLTHKGCIKTESAAAVAGGITSFMEMPNVVPPTLSAEKLEEKMAIAARDSHANYSFFLGASNENLEAVLAADPSRFCGLKIFMGSSTGNMLVDHEGVLRELFTRFKGIIALHCEDEGEVRARQQQYRCIYGENVPIEAHPHIRNHAACLKSSQKAVQLAQETDAQIHILHISTAVETQLFSPGPLDFKKITSEACIHHLYFTDADYSRLGSRIKWNPAVKTAYDRDMIWQALHDGRIDIIATDHAPHTWEEKSNAYFSCPSGGPLVQHGLLAMLEMSQKGYCDLPFLVEKMCHNPAKRFQVKDRGFIRPGYYADLVAVDLSEETRVTPASLLCRVKWSPFDGHVFPAKITSTWVNGELAWDGEYLNRNVRGMRLETGAAHLSSPR
jgi:dihydroorotase